jgi:hypothetical protein
MHTIGNMGIFQSRILRPISTLVLAVAIVLPPGFFVLCPCQLAGASETCGCSDGSSAKPADDSGPSHGCCCQRERPAKGDQGVSERQCCCHPKGPAPGVLTKEVSGSDELVPMPALLTVVVAKPDSKRHVLAVSSSPPTSHNRRQAELGVWLK